MLSQALRAMGIFQKVKTEVPLGAINTPDYVMDEHNYDLINLGFLGEDLEELVLQDQPVKSLLTDRIKATYLLRAVLAKCFEGATCDGQTALVYLETLKSGIDHSMELIGVSGTLQNGSTGGHIFTVINRDCKTDVAQPKSWRPKDGDALIINDTWSLSEKTAVFFSNATPDFKDLVNDNFFNWKVPFTIISSGRVEKNLTKVEWDELILFLKRVKIITSQSTLKFLIKKNNITFYNCDTLYNKIRAIIDAEIEELKQLADNPAVTIKFSVKVNKIIGNRQTSYLGSSPSQDMLTQGRLMIADALPKFKKLTF